MKKSIDKFFITPPNKLIIKLLGCSVSSGFRMIEHSNYFLFGASQ
jgi:hypothetical protein